MHRMLVVRLCAALGTFLLAAAAHAQLVRPVAPFDVDAAPPAPDYADAASWAALPETRDAADVVPPGATDRQAEGRADVFFVHPTTYTVGRRWNGAVGDPALDRLTDASLRTQASIFNAAGPVYAPRYRQGIFFAYVDHEQESLAARELAYGDVLRAFESFQERRPPDRPFVLAGHGQGAHHVLRLLEEHVAGTPLADALVAAYLSGASLPEDKLERTLPGIPVCRTPSHTGCIAAWNTVREGIERTRFRETRHHYPEGWEKNGEKALVCLNPISWTVGDALAKAKGTRRAVHLGRDGDLLRAAGPRQARCWDGLLEISPEPGFAFRPRALGDRDYHRSDLPLFHFDLRENLERRVSAFFGRDAVETDADG